jgi:hypothetical protein
MYFNIWMYRFEINTQMPNDCGSGEEILLSVTLGHMCGDAEFAVVIEKCEMKIAPSCDKAAEETLDGICCVKQLKARVEVDMLVAKAVKEDGIALNEKQFITRVVSNDVYATAEQLGVPFKQLRRCRIRLGASHRVEVRRWGLLGGKLV